MNKDEFVNEFIKDDLKFNKRLKNKPNKCLFPGCEQCAIKSHTISKENSLRSIAENGQVLTFKPVIKDRIHELIPRLVGVNDASTVQGYCHEHDSLFNDIDNKPFESEYDIVLQLFRCIGKWKFIEAQGANLIDSHRQTLIDFENQIFEQLGMPKRKNDTPSYRPGFDEMDAMYAELAQMIVSDKEQLKGHSIQGKDVIKLEKWTVLYKHLSYQIPLALSSKHVIGLRTGSSERKVFNIFWNIVPQTDQTDIMILLDAGGVNNALDANIVEKNWAIHTSCDLAILETVEAVMASTEEWYINPSVYDSLSDEKKENLSFDIRYKCLESPVWETINYTVFEQLWKNFVNLESDSKIKTAAVDKINYTPKVPTEEERKEAENYLSKSQFNLYHPEVT